MCFEKETYFGLKLHALVTIDGFVSDFFLTSAGIDDRLAVFELTENKPSIKIIADKGYIDDNLKCKLENERDILLISLKRKNSKNPLEKQLRNVLSKTR
ncbi:transposase DDE domain protein [Clostridium botulinum 202F]|nr:transposase DDE domain protein [Clostridium botulinum 202F]